MREEFANTPKAECLECEGTGVVSMWAGADSTGPEDFPCPRCLPEASVAAGLIADARHAMSRSDYMVSSQESCLATAETLLDEGRPTYAAAWALRAMQYSLGVFHAGYKAAEAEAAAIGAKVL